MAQQEPGLVYGVRNVSGALYFCCTTPHFCMLVCCTLENVSSCGATELTCGLIVGDMYPRARIQGIDLSPIQPDFVPPNVCFFVDDMEHESGWDYKEEKFDYIHIRHVFSTIRNRGQLMERIYK